jgi:S-adenosylmethionine hydrolase
MAGLGNARSLHGAGALRHADLMIVLFTDFGLHGPYTGQMKVVLHQAAPGIPAIDLFADAPAAPFWYENSTGLVEIAVNQGRADREFGLSIGTPVEIAS